MLSDSSFARVIYTLRIADAHLFAEARKQRVSRRIHHSAKQRASKLGLKVDTDKAARLSVKEVSTRPYPMIVQTYSPVVESNVYMSTTSWVAGPTAHDLINVNAALSEHLAAARGSMRGQFTEMLMYPSSGYDACSVSNRSLPDVPSEARSDWGSDILTNSTSTTGSSSVIVTPEDGHEPLRIRINFNKRKSSEIDDGVSYVEKRPKYGRKNWVLTLRQNNL